jgi:alpha-ribazole phosphatase
MTRLLLIRHGSTEWNAEGRYQGQTNTPLNDDGREQASRLAERLRSEDIDALYTSDLQRARQTAEMIVVHHGLKPQPEPRLREISFGAWEGKTFEEIQEHNPESLADWYDDPLHGSPPRGETLQHVIERTGAAYDAIVEQHAEETVAVVAHGGTLRALLCLAIGVDPAIQWTFQFDLASLSELSTYDEGAILHTLNNTVHLRTDRPHRATRTEETVVKRTSEGKLILVLGGARSGKSDFAQQMVEDISDSEHSPRSAVLFVATAEARDPEMERRIAVHRRARPSHWQTVEAPRHAGEAILDAAAKREYAAVLVDCVTLLTSNLLMEAEDPFDEEVEAALVAEVEDLVACAKQLGAPVVVVSNEVGLGLVPPSALGRAYRDLLGRANQALADAADEVILLVAGIPTTIKGGA